MTIFTGTFIPYEYENKRDALKHVISRCQNLQKSLRLICPLSGDYLEIVGTEADINWLHAELTKGKWYRTS